MARILVVEDESHIADGLQFNLEAEGYEVDVASTGREATERLACEDSGFDLVILDLMLPEMSGLEVARRMRAAGNYTSILMLTALDDAADVVRGLEEGADDYLTKPFSPQELTLRVEALIRRLGAPAVSSGGSSLVAGPVSIDRTAHRAYLDGEEMNLTATEYRLLEILLERRGRAQSRAQLLESVWEAQPDIQTRTVDMHVQRLRAKLGDEADLIETVRGLGYRFRGPDEDTAQ